jgi:flagellin
MGISIGTNISALQAQRRLNQATSSIAKSYERLSSGQRINNASDDAAGLAIADSLRAQTRIATVAIRNANDGISSLSIADSALGEIGNVLTRLAELAQQSANGVFSTTQRSALALEFTALGSEVERIAVTTAFNGLNLLSVATQTNFQVGFNGSQNSIITVQGVSGTLQALGLAAANSSALSVTLNGATNDAALTSSRQALDAVNGAIQSLASTRAVLGSAGSRLEVAINSIAAVRENFAAAESRIRDVDVAAEAAELTRLSVLQQAGTAILAQANQQPGLALRLLN